MLILTNHLDAGTEVFSSRQLRLGLSNDILLSCLRHPEHYTNKRFQKDALINVHHTERDHAVSFSIFFFLVCADGCLLFCLGFF